MYVERGTTSVIAKMQKKKKLKSQTETIPFLNYSICCLYFATIPLNALSESLYNPNAFLCIFSFQKKPSRLFFVFCATFFAIYSKKNVISTQRFLLEWHDKMKHQNTTKFRKDLLEKNKKKYNKLLKTKNWLLTKLFRLHHCKALQIFKFIFYNLLKINK
jgi:hypothetical protein